MEKLSSILPASPRIKSVDLSEAKPRRPGSPTFGVPEGTTSSQRDRVSISSRDSIEALKDNGTYKNPRDFKTSKMAEEVTKKFFETRLNPTDKIAPKSEAVVDGLDEKLEETTVAETEGTAKSAPVIEGKLSGYSFE